jgi:hypothetical protein
LIGSVPVGDRHTGGRPDGDRIRVAHSGPSGPPICVVGLTLWALVPMTCDAVPDDCRDRGRGAVTTQAHEVAEARPQPKRRIVGTFNPALPVFALCCIVGAFVLAWGFLAPPPNDAGNLLNVLPALCLLVTVESLLATCRIVVDPAGFIEVIGPVAAAGCRWPSWSRSSTTTGCDYGWYPVAASGASPTAPHCSGEPIAIPARRGRRDASRPPSAAFPSGNSRRARSRTRSGRGCGGEACWRCSA